MTEADRKSETLIVERLQSHFPDHAIVAEEGGGQKTGSDYCWYVDPLDGTTNFAHGFPIFCVTLGLAYRGEVVAGVVYDPTRDELFTVERGAGAFLNGQRLSVSKNANLSDCLVATGFPPFASNHDLNVEFYFRFTQLTHGIRRAGSAALDLCCVAAGRFDGFWELKLNPWDKAAGTLLVTEAGGRVSGITGKPFELLADDIFVSNGLNSRSDGRRVQRGPGAARRRGRALLRNAGLLSTERYIWIDLHDRGDSSGVGDLLRYR